MNSPSVAVVGSGAIGCLFAAEISRAGCDVVLISRRAELVRQVAKCGLTIHDERDPSTTRSRSFPVPARLPDAIHDEVDVVLLAVKSADMAWAVPQSMSWVKPKGIIISLQNGLRGADLLESQSAHGVAGATYQGAVTVELAEVRWTLSGPTSIAPRSLLAGTATEFATHVDRPGFEWHVSDDRDAMLWEKMIVVVSNSLSGALATPVNRLLASATARNILADARREAADLADALEIGLDTQALLRRLGEMRPASVGDTLGSTYQSLASGRRPEVDDLSGHLSELGHRVGIATPVNDLLARLTEARCELEDLR